MGIGGDWALPTLYFASYLDITVGMMILLNYRIVCMLWFSVIIVVGYTLIITLLAPHHWLHPLWMRTQKHSFAYEHLCGYCAREKQMSYEILKLIHLLSMLLLLGIGSGLAFYKYMTDKKRKP